MATYDQLRVLADRAFHAYTVVDSRADEWVKGLAVWQRPKNLDLSTWTSKRGGDEVVPVSVLPSDDELGATLLLEGTILDDDGVAVIASQHALKTRYSRQTFDYEFPKALLEGMAAHELLCWMTGGEGEHAITLEKVTSSVAFKTIAGPETTPEFAIGVAKSDSLLILPYSQFTFGCSGGREFDLKNRLGSAVSVEPGLYAIRVLRSGGTEDGEFGGSSFRVLLCAAAEAPRAGVDPDGDESDLPGWRCP